MEKLIFSEELRGIFREIFKKEMKVASSNISFLSSIDLKKINDLTLEQKEWIKNSGLVQYNATNKNADRNIYSHIFSALYAGIYGMNFVDVTASCLDTIKKQKGLKPNCNLIEHLSPEEIRNFSIALYSFSNKISSYKKAGLFQKPSLANFYHIADLAFSCGHDVRVGQVKTQNSDFINKPANPLYKASNSHKTMIDSVKLGTFSEDIFNIKDESMEAKVLHNNIKLTLKQIIKQLKDKDLSDQQISKVLGAVDEGFYKTRYFRNHQSSTLALLKKDQVKLSRLDLKAHSIKLLHSKLLLEKFFSTPWNDKSFDSLLNLAYKAGKSARHECEFSLKTSPEFFASFAQTYLINFENVRDWN